MDTGEDVSFSRKDTLEDFTISHEDPHEDRQAKSSAEMNGRASRERELRFTAVRFLDTAQQV